MTLNEMLNNALEVIQEIEEQEQEENKEKTGNTDKATKFKKGLAKVAKTIKPRNQAPGIAGATMAMADERATKAKEIEK